MMMRSGFDLARALFRHEINICACAGKPGGDVGLVVTICGEDDGGDFAAGSGLWMGWNVP